MAQTKTDLVVIGPTSHMTWLVGVSAHGDERPVLLMVTQDHAGFLMPKLNEDSVRQHTDLPFFCWTDATGPNEALALMKREYNINRPGLSIALDEAMRADFALLVIDALPDAKHKFLPETVGWLRCRKEEREYQLLKENALLTDAALKAAFDSLTAGMTEMDVIAVVEAYFAEHNAQTEFCSVCFGSNGAFPHHDSGKTRLVEGMAVMVDLGCRKNGYPSDMTRSGHFGTMPAGMAEIHNVVEAAVSAALAAAKPGVMARDVDGAARSVIADAGYGDYFPHRTGHGLGIDIHEGPFISANSEIILDEGMVFSIEPGIYLPGRFGLRLEDIVILRETGAEVLSALPRNLISSP